jgi:hypothetical protein
VSTNPTALFLVRGDLFCDNQFLQGVCGCLLRCLHMRCFCPFCICCDCLAPRPGNYIYILLQVGWIGGVTSAKVMQIPTYSACVCRRNGAINFNEMSVYKSQVPELKSLVCVHMHKFSSTERVSRICGVYDVSLTQQTLE